MISRKTIIYLSGIAVVLIIFAIIGKQAGWFGASISYDVAVENVSRRDITEVITANGKIQPETEVKISPDVSGEIIEIVVQEGDAVKTGQYLLRIKPDNYISIRDRAQAAVNSAKANLASARAMLAQVEARYQQALLTYNRSEILWNEQAISQSEWESAQSAFEIAKSEVAASKQNVAAAEFSVQSAEASLNEASENLTKTYVYAPIDGYITSLDVEKGERVVGTELMTGTEMMRVANLDRMEILAQVNENDIVRVQLQDSVIIEVDAFPDRPFKGVVTEIANSATTTGVATDQVTNFEVKILIFRDSYSDLVNDLTPQPLRPGMSASVDILTESKYSILSVPLQSVTLMADSLITDEMRSGSIESEKPIEIVFVVDNGKVITTEVTTGIQDNNYIEILSGLSEEDEVVYAPYNVITKRLKDGTSVKVVPEEELKGL